MWPPAVTEPLNQCEFVRGQLALALRMNTKERSAPKSLKKTVGGVDATDARSEPSSVSHSSLSVRRGKRAIKGQTDFPSWQVP